MPLKEDIQKLIAREFRVMQRVYAPVHDYQFVSLDEFPHLNRRFYEGTGELLKTFGFLPIGDLHAKGGSPDWQSVGRYLSGDHGTIVANIYEVRPAGAARLKLARSNLQNSQTVSFFTELTDGVILVTTNSRSAFAFPKPLSVMVFQYRGLPPAPELLSKHRECLAWIIAQKPGVTAVVIQTGEQLIASLNRYQLLLHAYFSSDGFSVDQYVERYRGILHVSAMRVIGGGLRTMRRSSAAES